MIFFFLSEHRLFTIFFPPLNQTVDEMNKYSEVLQIIFFVSCVLDWLQEQYLSYTKNKIFDCEKTFWYVHLTK